MEIAIYWFPYNMKQTMALIDTGVQCTLIYSNPKLFSGSLFTISGYEGQFVRVHMVTLTMAIGSLNPQPYSVYISPIPEYILEVDILLGLWLQTAVGKFCLWVPVVKAVL